MSNSGTRSETITSGDLELEAVVHIPDSTPGPGIVVCHPHPLYGGDMHNNAVSAVCSTASALGFVALRFNFRGVGASGGSFGNGVGERDDALAALTHLRALPEVQGKVVLAGYSFGAAVALVAAPPGIDGLVAISTPTIAQGLEDIAVDCPVLLVVGDRDQVAPPERLAGLGRFLRIPPEVVTIAGADHFWFGLENELADTVGSFLSRVVLGR